MTIVGDHIIDITPTLWNTYDKLWKTNKTNQNRIKSSNFQYILDYIEQFLVKQMKQWNDIARYKHLYQKLSNLIYSKLLKHVKGIRGSFRLSWCLNEPLGQAEYLFVAFINMVNFERTLVQLLQLKSDDNQPEAWRGNIKRIYLNTTRGHSSPVSSLLIYFERKKKRS